MLERQPLQSVFPIVMTDPWRNEIERIDDLFDLASMLEFYDDYSDDPLEFVGQDSSRLRVIVYAVEVLLCQRVPSDFDFHDLEIRACQAADGTFVGIAEAYRDAVHRVLFSDKRLPTDPLDKMPVLNLGDKVNMPLQTFNDDWLRAKPAGRQQPANHSLGLRARIRQMLGRSG